jgi:Ca2+-binding EF-hand superfamily protein
LIRRNCSSGRWNAYVRYKGFQRDCPLGELRQSDFVAIYQQFFPFGDSTQFAEYVFNAFDINGSGVVEFKEFMVALSITTRGKMEERLKCIDSISIRGVCLLRS